MASDLPRFSRLSKTHLVPAPDTVALPTFGASWQGTGFAQQAQYYKLTNQKKSRNQTAVWEGEGMPTAETTLASNGNADHPRLIVTPGSDADGFKVYQSLTTGTEKFWADVRITRDSTGNITGASVNSGSGTIAATTSTTVTWDGPSGQNQTPGGGAASPPTVDRSELEYLVLPEYAFALGPAHESRGIAKTLADGTRVVVPQGHVQTPAFRYEATTTASMKDIRKILGWSYVRFRWLPDTDWARYDDVSIEPSANEQVFAQFENGPRSFEVRMQGLTVRSEPLDPFRS